MCIICPLSMRLHLFHLLVHKCLPTSLQENYLRPCEKQRADDALERAAQASQLIAMADGMAGSFELGGTMALLGTVYPTALMASKEQSFAKPAFPAYLQQLGRGPFFLGGKTWLYDYVWFLCRCF